MLSYICGLVYFYEYRVINKWINDVINVFFLSGCIGYK